MSDSPSRLLSCTSKPGSQTPAPTPSECVRTHARPCAVDGHHVRRVLAAFGARLEHVHEREHALGLRESGESGKPREELRDAREAATGRDAAAVEVDGDGIAPDGAIVGEVRLSDDDPVHTERAPPRSSRGRRSQAPSSASASSAWTDARLVEELARLQQPAVADEQLAAPLEGVELAEHVERTLVHLGKHDTATGQVERRLAQPSPREPPETVPELAECSRKAGDGARRGTYRVHDELVAEGDGELGELARGGRDGCEPVEVHDARAVEDDRMAPGEQAAVDRLGDAGGERHRDDGIGGGTALCQDLGADLGSGRMACGDSRPHEDEANCCSRSRRAAGPSSGRGGR